LGVGKKRGRFRNCLRTVPVQKGESGERPEETVSRTRGGDQRKSSGPDGANQGLESLGS